MRDQEWSNYKHSVGYEIFCRKEDNYQYVYIVYNNMWKNSIRGTSSTLELAVEAVRDTIIGMQASIIRKINEDVECLFVEDAQTTEEVEVLTKVTRASFVSLFD